jgi:hypothetical protein
MYPATNKFTILCEINAVEHPNDVSTQCSQLIKDINYYDDAATIVEQGGTFGCYPTKFADEVTNACVPEYNPETTLASCLSCTHMGVCIKFPDPKLAAKSLPKKK